jgi:hypothetical protein
VELPAHALREPAKSGNPGGGEGFRRLESLKR